MSAPARPAPGTDSARRWCAERLRALSTRRHRLFGLAVLRIVLGLVALDFYLSEYGRRGLLCGPEGYVPLAAFRESVPLWGTSVYAWSASPAWFESVHHLGILAAAAFCVCGGRALAVLHGLLLWSVQLRAGQALDQAEVLARLPLPVLALTTCDAYLSPFARRRRAALATRPERVRGSDAVHNCAVFLVVFQLCAVHAAAGAWRLATPGLRDGTALAALVRALDVPPDLVVTTLACAVWATVVGGYLGAVARAGHPLPAATGRLLLRGGAALGAAGAHLAGAPPSGAVTLCAVLLAADAVLLRDADFHAVAGALPVRALASRRAVRWWPSGWWTVGRLPGRLAPLFAASRPGPDGGRPLPGPAAPVPLQGVPPGPGQGRPPRKPARPSGTMDPCPDARPPARLDGQPAQAGRAVSQDRPGPARAATPPTPRAADASTPERRRSPRQPS